MMIRLTTMMLLVCAIAASGCGGEQQDAKAPVPGPGVGTTGMTGASTASGIAESAKKQSSGKRSGGSATSADQQATPAPAGGGGARVNRLEGNLRLYAAPTSGVSVSRPTLVPIENQADLDRWTGQMAAGGQAAPKISIDFKQGRQGWAVFMPKSPAGAELQLVNVMKVGGSVRVVATMVVPGKGCKASGGATNPTAWGETAKATGRAQLRVVTPRKSCSSK